MTGLQPADCVPRVKADRSGINLDLGDQPVGEFERARPAVDRCRPGAGVPMHPCTPSGLVDTGSGGDQIECGAHPGLMSDVSTLPGLGGQEGPLITAV